MEKLWKIVLPLAAVLIAGSMLVQGLFVNGSRQQESSQSTQSQQEESESGTDGEKQAAGEEEAKTSQKINGASDLKKIELRTYENTLQPDTSVGLFWPGKLVEHEGTLYCTYMDMKITAMDLDGSNRRNITDNLEEAAEYLLITDQYIYVNCTSYTIKQYTFDGELVGQIGEVLNWGSICNWCFHNGYFYFQGMCSDQEKYSGLYRIYTGDGEYPECVTANCNSYNYPKIYFYGDRIYYFDFDINYCSIAEDGSDEKILKENTIEPDNKSTLHGAENYPLANGRYVGNELYYMDEKVSTYRKLNIETMKDEEASWNYTFSDEFGSVIGEDAVSVISTVDYVRIVKYFQVSTGEETKLQEYVKRLPSGLVESVKCDLIEVPGATRIYYIAEPEGERNVYAISLQGGDPVKLDALYDMAQYFLLDD